MKELYKKLKGEKTNLTIYWSGGIVSYLNMPIKARSICEGTWLYFISFVFPLAYILSIPIISHSKNLEKSKHLRFNQNYKENYKDL
jgi:hypothetical protein